MFLVYESKTLCSLEFKLFRIISRNQRCSLRQGRILSPHLFKVYMDTLSTELNNINIGCCIDEKLINHLIYADDIVLFAPSAKGLQCLINICFNYGNLHNITFNESKTVGMHIESIYISGKV